ncbi:MAG: DNA mismatch repair endonuclease MutL [Ruminococcaceae bacterium]|nr:DNA mismatch repair endonuclease MutL [Oscillospiraceae bacterium]
MSKIAVLDKHTAELIAAGEVVERPSSVIKELVENCMDAGATSISVEIKNGGVTYMSVTDNGEGMERDDVPVAFLRHATSKVRTAPDLDAISTLGFRGEALASIAAVARVELITRREEDLAGTHYTIEGGTAGELSDIGCAKGTTIVVRDLFFNVPARMKFLKKDVSEGNAVAAVMDRLALSHPEIAFRFVRDGKEELQTSGDGDLRGCIYSVLGREFSKNLLPVDYSLDGVRVYGFVSAPSSSRPNRTMQHFFVNGRYVKTRTAMAALEQAFKGAIMSGKFPACVLFIELAPETVDANVHPAKIEIRFMDERPVFSAVYHAVQNALSGASAPKSVSLPPKAPSAPAGRQLVLDFSKPLTPPAPPKSAPTAQPPAEPKKPSIFRVTEEYAGYDRPSLTVGDVAQQWGNLQEKREPTYTPPAQTPLAPTAQPTVIEPPQEPEPPEVRVVEEQEAHKPVHYIGELFSTYLLAEMDGSLYVIDKHAAHERLLYNQLTATEHADSQQLLAPLSVTLSREEYAALMMYTEELARVGFEVEEFGGREVLIRAVPMILSGCDVAAVIREIAGGFADGARTVRSSALDWIYHSTACRAAVKAGDESRPAELAAFAQRVLYHDDLRTCPHGRPVCFSLTKQEIEKQFGRII